MAVRRLSSARILGDSHRTVKRTERGIHLVDQSHFFGNASTHTHTRAITPEPGDVFVVVGGTYNSGTAPSWSAPSSSPSGLTFTEIVVQGVQASPAAAWYAIATDSTTRTISTATSISCLGMSWCGLFRGVDLADPLDVDGYGEVLAASSTPTLTAVTTVTEGAVVVAAVNNRDDNFPRMTSTGWVEHVYHNNGSAHSMIVATRKMASPGSTGSIETIQVSNGPDAANGLTFALRPAA